MKKIIVCLFLMFPIIINAECDTKLREEGKNLASNITSEISYSDSKKTFSITLYNVADGMSIQYGKNTYTPKDEKITIDNIKEGQRITLSVFYKDGCSQEVLKIKKAIPYYNEFYKSLLCDDYEEVLYVCSTQFTSYAVSEEVVELAIKNYETKRYQEDNNVEIPKEEKESVIEKAKEIANKWAIKFALLIGSSTIAIIIGNSAYRKEVHGV